MKRIPLILTSSFDVHTDYVEEKMKSRGVQYLRLDSDLVLGGQTQLTWNMSNGSIEITATTNGEKVKLDIETISSVWFRKVLMSKFDSTHKQDSIRFTQRETEAFFLNMYKALETLLWVNKPKHIRIADNKLYQLSVAQECGLEIPKTLVTNDPKLFRSFCSQHHDNGVIYKTLSHPFIAEHESYIQSVYTSLVDSVKISDESIRAAPCLFQENILKDYELRIVVLEEHVYSARLYSQEHQETSIDWRRNQDTVTVRHEACSLPVYVHEACLKIVKTLQLSYGAIDMMVTPDGRYVFVEINSNGNWLWLEKILNFPIADKLIDILMWDA